MIVDLNRFSIKKIWQFKSIPKNCMKKFLEYAWYYDRMVFNFFVVMKIGSVVMIIDCFLWTMIDHHIAWDAANRPNIK